jgi:hypothetical protein
MGTAPQEADRCCLGAAGDGRRWTRIRLTVKFCLAPGTTDAIGAVVVEAAGAIECRAALQCAFGYQSELQPWDLTLTGGAGV